MDAAGGSAGDAGAAEPNFGRDDHAFWYHSALDGIKVTLRFMGQDGLGEARYTVVGEKSRPVASIEREMNGRSIFKLLQERATQRSEERQAQHGEAGPARSGYRARGTRPSVITVDTQWPAPTKQPRREQIIAAEALAASEPGSRYAITGEEGVRESFTYELQGGEVVLIRLMDEKVVKVR